MHYLMVLLPDDAAPKQVAIGADTGALLCLRRRQQLDACMDDQHCCSATA